MVRVLIGVLIGILLGGLTSVAVYLYTGIGAGNCGIIEGREDAREAMTYREGELVERCRLVIGASRRTVRAVLGDVGLHPSDDGPGAPMYYQLQLKSGNSFYNSCVLELVFAKRRVVKTEAMCESD